MLIPSTSQAKRIDRWIDNARLVYNLAKEVREYAWQTQRVSLSYETLAIQLPALKQAFPFLKNMDSQAMQDAVERLANAFKKYVKSIKDGTLKAAKSKYYAKYQHQWTSKKQRKYDKLLYPTWAKKDEYVSFTLKKAQIIEGKLFTVKKLGGIKLKDTWHLPKDTVFKTATIKKEGHQYFVCLTAAVEPIKRETLEKTIGVDMGVSHFVSTSDNTTIDMPSFLKESSKKLIRLQRKLTKRQKLKGKNWYKTKKQITKLHKKVSNQRRHMHHQISNSLIDDNQVIVLEDLSVRNMTAKAVGKGKAAKSGLNRSILDKGISGFVSILAYKAKLYGRTVLLVDPKYTSQTCFECGEVSKENRKSQANFCCVSCGHTDHADVNAAKNILRKGIPHPRQAQTLVGFAEDSPAIATA